MIEKQTNNSASKTLHRVPLYKRAWFIGLFVIILIAIIVFIIVIIAKPQTEEVVISTETDPSSVESQIDDSEPTLDTTDDEKQVIQNEGEDANLSNELSGYITYTDYTEGIFNVGTVINQYLSDGTCELKMSDSNGQTYSTSSVIVAGASTSACYDLSLEVDSGHYNLEITLISDNKTGLIAQEVDI